MGLKQFDWFPATFKPQRTDDLKPAATEWIDWTGLWEAAFLIEEGPYEGQFACTIHPKHLEYEGRLAYPPASAFAWVPESDLAPVHMSKEALAEIQKGAEAILREKGERGELRGDTASE